MLTRFQRYLHYRTYPLTVVRFPVPSSVRAAQDFLIMSPAEGSTVRQKTLVASPNVTLTQTESHSFRTWIYLVSQINPLNHELNPICYLLALLAHLFLHVSKIRVKSLNFRLLMSYIYIYIYGAPILDVSRSHTTTQHSR